MVLSLFGLILHHYQFKPHQVMKKVAYIIFVVFSIFGCKNAIQKDHSNSQKEVVEAKRKGAEGRTSPFDRREVESLKTDFVGLTTSQGKEDKLFPIKSTGVSTLPIKLAGEVFLKALTKKQLANTQFDIQDDEWRKWCNVDNGIYTRQGISIKEMNQEQRKLAFHLMEESLSAKGLQLSKDIMKTDQTLKELNGDNPIFDEELYFFTIMGTPSMTEPWGWQIDGHHLVINYFILGDQVVMTPTFMGGEPIITTTGKYKGNVIFQDEQNIGLKFMQSLNGEQQKKATLSDHKQRNDIQAEAFSDNAKVDYQGLPVSEMTTNQKADLLHLISLYINNMQEGQAQVKMEKIKEHIERTYFTWIGQTDENAVFYYRVHSPVILIEFDHQSPVGVRGNGRNPTRNHIHTIVRTPNGNDYGKDYLRQHLEQHHNH